MLQNLVFVIRYLLGLPKEQRECVDVHMVDTALKCVFLRAQVVGDKHPDYVFGLDKLAELDGLSRLVIYRDARDVTSSALTAYTAWGEWWGKELSAAAGVAARWVRAIELMERCIDKVYAIRYENLVTDPQGVLKALANWLGVDHRGFEFQMVRASSVGKHRGGLSAKDLEDIIRVAGPTMERLGYEI